MSPNKLVLPDVLTGQIVFIGFGLFSLYQCTVLVLFFFCSKIVYRFVTVVI